jgi:hypothetical protein
MARPPRTLTPGRYRAYLAPAAVTELLDMLAWGGFDLKTTAPARPRCSGWCAASAPSTRG